MVAAKLFLIHSKSPVIFPSDQWRQEFKREHICLGYGCSRVLPFVYKKKMGIDIYIDEKPNIAALNIVYPEIDVARRDFLELFEHEVNDYLKTGSVFLSDGTLLDQYITFCGERRLFLRGSDKSQYMGQCKHCGQYRYVPRHPLYILAGSYFEQPIYQPCGPNGLIVNEELCGRIEKGKWKGIYITELPIVDKPKDGVDEIPNDLVV